jgi:hypothetical protein
MLRILWTDEQMEIDKAAPGGRDVEPQLHIRKYQFGGGQPSGLLMPQHFFVGVGHIVISDRDGLDDRRGLLKGGEVIMPRSGAAELVVHHRARRVNMRLPPPPFRPRFSIFPPSMRSRGWPAWRCRRIAP